MGNAYQIKNQEVLFFLTFQVVGWADVLSRQLYKDIILEMIFRYHAKYNKRSGEEQLWTPENNAVELSTNSLIKRIPRGTASG